MADTTQLVEKILAGVQGYVVRSLAPLFERLKVVEARQPEKGDRGTDGVDGKDAPAIDVEVLAAKVLASVRVPVDGRDGKDGIDGKDAPAVDVDALAAKVLASVRVPADGRDGKDGQNGVVDMEAVDALIKAAAAAEVAAIPKPINGNNGVDGKDGKDAVLDLDLMCIAVDKAVAAIPRPADGKDADPAVVAKMVADAVAAIPKPADGKDADHAIVVATVAKVVAELPKPADGRKGEDGRDAIDIEIIEAISQAKRYQRGTYAAHRGGVWKAVRPTDMLPPDGDPFAAGWSCVWRGIDEAAIEVGADQRSFAFGLKLSDGTVVHKSVTVPVTIHRDVWRADGYELDGVFRAYQRGDQVTRDGSQWTLMADVESAAPGTPGVETGWKLSSKRGKDGRDGLRGEKGDRGAEGKAVK